MPVLHPTLTDCAPPSQMLCSIYIPEGQALSPSPSRDRPQFLQRKSHRVSTARTPLPALHRGRRGFPLVSAGTSPGEFCLIVYISFREALSATVFCQYSHFPDGQALHAC